MRKGGLLCVIGISWHCSASHTIANYYNRSFMAINSYWMIVKKCTKALLPQSEAVALLAQCGIWRALELSQAGNRAVWLEHVMWRRGGQYCLSQQLDLLSPWHASPAVFQSLSSLVYYLVSPSDSIPSIWCDIRCFMGLRVYLGSLGFKVLYVWHWNYDEITVRGEPAFLCTWLLQHIPFGAFFLSAASRATP